MLVVTKVTCNQQFLVAIVDIIMQRTVLRGNIYKICVGNNRGHMQQTIVGSNEAYCNQNQWSRISLLQRGETESSFSIIFVGREYHK
jgi:hypothetical protein